EVRRNGKVVAGAVLRPDDSALLPGGSVVLTGQWMGRPVWGSARVRAVGTATSPDGTALSLVTASRRVHFAPWWLILMAVVALLLSVALVVIWRRRLRRVGQQPGQQLRVIGEEAHARQAA